MTSRKGRLYKRKWLSPQTKTITVLIVLPSAVGVAGKVHIAYRDIVSVVFHTYVIIS